MPAAWKTPLDWQTGQIVTETQLDEQVRDHALVTGEHVLGQIVATSTALAALDFTQIPQGGYESLRVTLSGRCEAAANNAAVGLQFATSTAASPTFDTSTNYAFFRATWNGSTAINGIYSAGSSYGAAGNIAAGSAAAGCQGAVRAEIPGYARTGFHKQILAEGFTRYGTTANEFHAAQGAAVWLNTKAIKAVRVTTVGGSNFSSGTVATLYGRRSTSTST